MSEGFRLPEVTEENVVRYTALYQIDVHIRESIIKSPEDDKLVAVIKKLITKIGINEEYYPEVIDTMKHKTFRSKILPIVEDYILERGKYNRLYVLYKFTKDRLVYLDKNYSNFLELNPENIKNTVFK